MENKKLTDSEIKEMVFISYLKKISGQKLNKNDKANIKAWEMLGKMQKDLDEVLDIDLDEEND